MEPDRFLLSVVSADVKTMSALRRDFSTGFTDDVSSYMVLSFPSNDDIFTFDVPSFPSG